MKIVQRSVRRLLLDVGPEDQILSGGLQPFLFRSAAGTLVAQAQWPYPVGYPLPEKNIYPGLPWTVISRDRGRRWSLWKPGPDQGQGPIIEGAVVELSEGTIRIFDWIADGPSPQGDFTGRYWDTSDEWNTLTGPTPFSIHLPQAKGGFDDGGKPYSGVTFHRTVLELPSGDLLAAIYCWFKEDSTPVAYEPKMCRFRSVLLRSSDKGANWEYASTIMAPPDTQEGANEPVMVRLSGGQHEGRLICLARTGQQTDPLFEAHSDDEGRSWSDAQPLPLRGVDPDLIEMSNGVLVCSFGHRAMGDPMPREHGNHVAFSTDQGETWTQITHLPLERGSGTDRSTCYTSVREIEAGKLMVLFDVGWWGTPIRYIARRIVQVDAL